MSWWVIGILTINQFENLIGKNVGISQATMKTCPQIRSKEQILLSRTNLRSCLFPHTKPKNYFFNPVSIGK